MSIRVRFAPSPTGFLHIGNARAALINWLFAHKHGGKFLLRLDDTDLQRSEQRFEKAIIEDLAWLGLNNDLYFKQSDRFDRYYELMQKLIQNGRLYPCYETPEELEFKRKRQMARGEPPIYDRASLSLTQDQLNTYKQEGRQAHWRFKLNPGTIKWNDLVRGEVSYEAENLSDPVLVRADGAYLYTITSVIDDIDFSITHILRGEDHVSNTAVQIQLFEALSNAPVNINFGHTTLLMDANGQALSKRLGSLSLGTMRESGIEPMAINSLLARLGTSQAVEPFLSLEDLVKTFDLATFSRTPPHFNEQDLHHLTHKIFQMMPFNEVEKHLNAKNLKCDEKVWNLIKGNIANLDEVKQWEGICNGDITIIPSTESQQVVECALRLLPSQPWTIDTWKNWTQSVQSETGCKGRSLFMPIRQAITGMDHGPEMKELILIIGHEKIQKRLQQALG